MAALATGLAGAFAIGRRDVSDTLPGVAIAISLVPPLANVGILLGAGRTDLAAGSMLLFVTNYFAILLTGTLVFGLMGFPQAALEGRTPRVKRAAIAVVVVMVFVIAAPLAYSSAKVIISNNAENRTAEATKVWLAGSGYRFVSVSSDDGRVSVLVRGSGKLPAQDALATALRGQLYGRAVHVDAVPSIMLDFATK
jgi:uncharacterized membrane protein